MLVKGHGSREPVCVSTEQRINSPKGHMFYSFFVFFFHPGLQRSGLAPLIMKKINTTTAYSLWV